MNGESSPVAGSELNIKKHIKYLTRSSHVLPASTASYDTSRMTIAFFALSGLDVLGFQQEDGGKRAKEWIRSLYVEDEATGIAGFHGGSFVKAKKVGFLHTDTHNGHIAMTYTALACLRILDDDLTGLDKAALTRGVRVLQQTDGSFNSALEGGENDMRFVFCAAAICQMLDDWSGRNLDAATKFILSSITYEGAFAQRPNLEAHGGSTYCAIAALKLMGRLDQLSDSQVSNDLDT